MLATIEHFENHQHARIEMMVEKRRTYHHSRAEEVELVDHLVRHKDWDLVAVLDKLNQLEQ